MPLTLFNTLRHAKEVFTPRQNGRVGCYVCGPTVYAPAHLGHARSAVFFDVVQRYLKSTGYGVCLVRNVTDIDDNIIAEANRLGRDYRNLARRQLAKYHRMLDMLGVQRPDHEPLATAHMAQIQICISRLIKGGHAYAANGSVYFSVDSFPEYGRFFGQAPASAISQPGWSANGDKRNPGDFALWKAKKANEPFWPSPWGAGRPGWHIECTAMSAHLLGPSFDIHGGGQDLIFPHHENETAQAMCLFGKPPADYWLHHGMVTVDGLKLSKSRAGYQPLETLLAQFPPEVVRYYLLTRPYRRPLDYTPRAMFEAVSGLNRILRFIYQEIIPAELRDDPLNPEGGIWQGFCQSMDDDFNTAGAIQFIFKVLRQDPGNGGLGPGAEIRGALDRICRHILGIVPASYSDYRRRVRNALARRIQDIDSLVKERVRARQANRWDEADALRRTLEGLGIQIKDHGGATTYKFGKTVRVAKD